MQLHSVTVRSRRHSLPTWVCPSPHIIPLIFTSLSRWCPDKDKVHFLRRTEARKKFVTNKWHELHLSEIHWVVDFVWITWRIIWAFASNFNQHILWVWLRRDWFAALIIIFKDYLVTVIAYTSCKAWKLLLHFLIYLFCLAHWPYNDTWQIKIDTFMLLHIKQ